MAEIPPAPTAPPDMGPIMAAARSDSQIVDGVEMCLFPTDETTTFYGVIDPPTLEWMRARLTPHPWRCFEQRLQLVNEPALQSIPQDLYEAAEVDGASKWTQFRRITLPLLKPALLPSVILGSVCVAIGLVADLLSVNRRLLEDLQAAQRRRDWQP